MKIVVAPDSFKGSMSSTAAANQIEAGFRSVDPLLEIVQIPMADGGEGTVDAILAAVGGERVTVPALDPLGRPITACYGWLAASKTAVIETAAASGLPLLTADERNPFLTSTYGTGQLIKAALDHGAETLVLGIGGSATVDAGTGCFQALGVRFANAKGEELNMCGGKLGEVEQIDVAELDPRLRHTRIQIASDVTNPLLGNEGAVVVFGPQKGLREEEFSAFEKAMTHYAQVMSMTTGTDYIHAAGSGAAGGFGFTLLSLLKVEMKSGLLLMSEWSRLEERIAAADLVITGEGRMDAQSLYGKVPVGIARLARPYEVPVVAFTGQMSGEMTTFQQEGLALVCPIVDRPMGLDEAIREGEALLYEASARLMETLRLVYR
ncbi:glycerate kinase [Marinicrinis sediminis]|uniref:Glycerate kinase n=1 Tax=Marinicrinis sediminis TaxID=1652465 RepID=A0ABW5R7I6_9BACL